ncbi:hypothetical protein GMDG_04496 [Pseudogymnoascus destructans 20631-21]|uniref:Uncharacterized protein n=2 Tax=Pseudogymnoascus destructans TaxID=655981 RepID=L8GDE1_PSED2|nr:hypothetical protein GMDG_04496 [Pseudogymnoascus destructans 20631-21]
MMSINIPFTAQASCCIMTVFYSAALRSSTNMPGIRAASDGGAKNGRELDVPISPPNSLGLRFSSKAWIISLRTSAIADHSQSWRWSVFDQLVEWSWTDDCDIDVPSATQNSNSTSRMDGISPLDTEKTSTLTLHQNWSANTTMRSDSISPPSTAATSISDLHQIRSDNLIPSSTDVHLCPTSSSHGLSATTGDCWPAGSTHELYRIIYLYTGEFCSTASELYSGLQASPLFRKHKVLAIFSVDENVWEILMPAGYVPEFCNCVANFGFAIERNSAPKPGFCMRALIV